MILLGNETRQATQQETPSRLAQEVAALRRRFNDLLTTHKYSFRQLEPRIGVSKETLRQFSRTGGNLTHNKLVQIEDWVESAEQSGSTAGLGVHVEGLNAQTPHPVIG